MFQSFKSTMVWCYFMLQDIKLLIVAGERLVKGREGIIRAHGKNASCVRQLYGSHSPDIVLYLRLELLEGLAAFHCGKLKKYREALTSTKMRFSKTSNAHHVSHNMSDIQVIGKGWEILKHSLKWDLGDGSQGPLQDFESNVTVQEVLMNPNLYRLHDLLPTDLVHALRLIKLEGEDRQVSDWVNGKGKLTSKQMLDYIRPHSEWEWIWEVKGYPKQLLFIWQKLLTICLELAQELMIYGQRWAYGPISHQRHIFVTSGPGSN
ncbi:NEDD8 ultimate buster 1 [Bienertia sinuspersici]